MKKGLIKYRKGYKYQLASDYALAVPITPNSDINTRYIDLTKEGWLVISQGYAWDGASGPTIDTPSCIRGSLVHDALYQLMRQGLLDRGWRIRADEVLYTLCREDGMSWPRAKIWERAVNWFARKSSTKKGSRKIIHAP